MSVEFDRGSPGKFDSRTLSRETLSRRTGRSFHVRVSLSFQQPTCQKFTKSVFVQLHGLHFT